MILERHLSLRLPLGFLRKKLSLCENIQILAKLFSFKWRGVNPTSKSDKNIENEISQFQIFTSHKIKKQIKTSKIIFHPHIIIPKITEKLALVILIIHY